MTFFELNELLEIIQSSQISEYRKRTIEEKLTLFKHDLERMEFELNDILSSFSNNPQIYRKLGTLISKRNKKPYLGLNVTNFDFAIICALESELSHVLNLLKNKEEIILSDSQYFFYKGIIESPHKQEFNVVCAYTNNMGFIDAAQLSSELIFRFNPRYLIMTGVCGGRASQGVNIGDIILPQNIFAYQFGKFTDSGFKNDMVNELTDDRIIQISKNIEREVTRIIFDNWKGKKGRQIKLFNDTMASGTAVINKINLLEKEISRLDRRLVAIDMESYAVMRTARLFKNFKVEPIIIKSVMDLTERKDEISDKQFASYTSSSFMHYLIDYLDFK